MIDGCQWQALAERIEYINPSMKIVFATARAKKESLKPGDGVLGPRGHCGARRAARGHEG